MFFVTKFIDDEQATKTLLENVEGKVMTEPKVIPFKTGIRDKAWHKNCLAIGLAQGFLEPLESTAIHLVTKSLAFFIRMFPTLNHSQVLENEFNRAIRQDYEEIRDFLVMHYCTTDREDSAFWRWCKQMDIPQTLQEKIDYFKVAGGVRPKAEELFQSTSWYAVLHGMKVEPDGYNPSLDTWDPDKLKAILEQGRQGLSAICNQQPSHEAFLKKYCCAPKL